VESFNNGLPEVTFGSLSDEVLLDAFGYDEETGGLESADSQDDRPSYRRILHKEQKARQKASRRKARRLRNKRRTEKRTDHWELIDEFRSDDE
jgi:hypothetical protein